MIHYARNAGEPATYSKGELLADFDEAKSIFENYVLGYWNAPDGLRVGAKNRASTAIDAFEAKATPVPGKALARLLRNIL